MNIILLSTYPPKTPKSKTVHRRLRRKLPASKVAVIKEVDVHRCTFRPYPDVPKVPVKILKFNLRLAILNIFCVISLQLLFCKWPLFQFLFSHIEKEF